MPTEHSHGNIIWSPAHPARNGRWPASHPVAANEAVFGSGSSDQFGKANAMNTFREFGYWASCFPEGDGITFSCEGKTPEQVQKDIEVAFGFHAAMKR